MRPGERLLAGSGRLPACTGEGAVLGTWGQGQRCTPLGPPCLGLAVFKLTPSQHLSKRVFLFLRHFYLMLTLLFQHFHLGDADIMKGVCPGLQDME